MKKIFKKNQVIITALVIMIAVAGYLNFTSDKQVLNTSVENMKSEGASGNSDDDTISAALEDTVGEEQYALEEENSGSQTNEAVTDVQAEALQEENADGQTAEEGTDDFVQASVDEDGNPIDSETVGEAVLTSSSVTLSQARLTREQTRSKAKEMLLEIINNENLSEDAKKDAVNKMLSMTERMEKESAAETQLAAKGFTDAIVSISDDSVDVTLSIAELTDTQRTQIENIIMRKTGCELNQIVITTTQAG
ncbi:MAG: SpoIIIAH-like family protein [Bacteroidales bacterium]|nr:SpoIIIAH-like family protein [Clostridium sp.]MCM1202636.1 SpoIIIAH-like family protein [Bacteroidales bacterium]